MLPPVPPQAPEFVRNVTRQSLRGTASPAGLHAPGDGTWPTGTTKWEKRSIAEEIPVWDPETCIQCGECSMVCPHAVIRMGSTTRPFWPRLANFKSIDAKGTEFEGMKFTIQVSPRLHRLRCLRSACPAFKKVNGEKSALRRST